MDLQKVIFKEWGLSNLPEAEQQKKLAQIADLLFQSIVFKGFDSLSDADQDKLDSLLEGVEEEKRPQLTLSFLEAHLDKFKELVEI